MNAKERYLAVFDDDHRKKLDHIPTFVQYLRPEFIRLHKEKFLVKNLPFHTTIPGFMEANFIGFESIFGDVHPGLR